jgi:flagellar biosynthesis/type III secretory pathway protein FliH
MPLGIRPTVELTKYNLDRSTIRRASKLEQWAFLLLRAQDFEADELERLLPGIDFKTAIETIEVISPKTEDKLMYDQREKAQRDYEWAISGARQEGREVGREEGREVGREEGERVGFEKGEMIGKLQILQELLGDPPTTTDQLAKLPPDALTTKLADLQQRLRDRPS